MHRYVEIKMNYLNYKINIVEMHECSVMQIVVNK